ncbi:MAG: efflux transporter outer membrane subunit, partial [Planctomycetes bacterium]|nr:efflux transporter outer membrane subunit [Planctomycetota bacterium]
QLDALIERALADNRDRRAATSRIQQARAAAGLAAAPLWPQLDATGSATRTRTTESTPSPVRGVHYNTFSLGFDASWELDLFGRISRLAEAGDAEVQLAAADADALTLSLVAEVVVAYADLVGATQRREFAMASVRTAEDLVAVNTARVRGGLGNELEIASAERLLAAARSRLPQQERDWHLAANRLAVLVGDTPDHLVAQLRDAATLQPVPDVVALGLPADLVRRRPDVRAADAAMHAATARLGAALADRWPRLSLTGFFGVQADDASDLFESGSRALSGGPAVRLPLFRGGSVAEQIAVEEAGIEVRRNELEQTVLRAFEEVENAAHALQQERVRREQLRVAVDAAERERQLAQQRFTAGLDDFTAVLNAEQSRLDLADQFAGSDTELVRQFAALQKALGGAVPPAPAAGG